jgi:L-2-hydroxyglutarate oxidase LhgO
LKTDILLIKKYINIIINSKTIFIFKPLYKELKKKLKKNLVQVKLSIKLRRIKKANNTKYHLYGK